MTLKRGMLKVVGKSTDKSIFFTLRARLELDLRSYEPGEARMPATAASNEMTSVKHLKTVADELFKMRRRRETVLPSRFGEAAWDILLAVFKSPSVVMSVKELYLTSEQPHTTTLRWLQVLEREGFLERVEHPTSIDGRLTCYQLTTHGSTRVGQALEAMLRD